MKKMKLADAKRWWLKTGIDLDEIEDKNYLMFLVGGYSMARLAWGKVWMVGFVTGLAVGVSAVSIVWGLS